VTISALLIVVKISAHLALGTAALALLIAIGVFLTQLFGLKATLSRAWSYIALLVVVSGTSLLVAFASGILVWVAVLENGL
jgi:hypothetical protein